MPQKKKTTPKEGSAETQTDHSASSEIPNISPPRGFSPKDDKKLQDLTSGIQESTHQFPSEAIKEVLNVLMVVERQFDKLRDEQQKQEAVYDELIQKIQVIEKAESKLSNDRKKLAADRKKVAETDKIALEMIEESRQTLLQKQKQFQSERQSSVKELAKLRSEIEQESKSLHAERNNLIQKTEKAENKAHEHSHIIEELNADRTKLAARVEQLQDEAQQATHRAKKASRETQELELQTVSQREDVQSRIDELQGDRNLLNARVEEIEQERNNLLRLRDEAEARNQELELRLGEMTDQGELLQNRLDEIQNEGNGNETHADSLHDRIAQLEEDLADRDRVIASLQEQGKSVSGKEMTAQSAAEESEIQTLRNRVAELENELAAARKASSGPMNDPNESPPADLEQIKENLKEAAIHLHRRQERLHRARRLARESRQTSTQVKPQALPAQTHEEEADLKRWVQNQRQRLAHDRTRLKDMESRMIKIWAPRNAALIVSALGLLLTILVVASWLTTSYVFPAHISASVTLKPKTSSLDPLTEEQTASWQLWHAELVQDDGFKKTLLKRMRDRQMPVETIDLDEFLEENLSLDTGMPGELTMTLSGTKKLEITDLLDVITSTVLTESSRQLKKRTDGAIATASNERKESGISRYAVINPTAIQDHRKFWMAPIFLLYGVLAFGVFKFALNQMTQVKRVINEEVIDTDESEIFNDDVLTSD